MSDDLVKRLREKPYRGGGESNDEAARRRQKEREDGADLIEAQAARIAALEAAVTQCRTLSAMLKPQADRIAELEAALDDALTYVWRAHGWSKLKPETQAYKFRKKDE